MYCFIKKQEGFTLVELMIAVAILAIGLLALAGLQVTAIRGNLSSKGQTTAVMLAEAKMEEFKNTAFSSLSNVTNQADSNNPLNESGQSGGRYNRYWTIQNYAGSSNMKQITVTVSWTETIGSRSISLDTVVAKE